MAVKRRKRKKRAVRGRKKVRKTVRRTKARRKTRRATKTRKRKVAGRKVRRKKAARRKVTRKKAARKAPKRKKKKAAKRKKRKASAAFMMALTPSADLAAVVGAQPLPRTQVVKKLWAYIKRNGLQDQKNRRMINADAKLKPVFGGRRQVNMFQMTALVSKHLK